MTAIAAAAVERSQFQICVVSARTINEGNQWPRAESKPPFGSIVKSLVADIIMPPIGLLLGNVDFSNLFAVIKQGSVAGTFATVAEAQKAGAVTINYGMFINTVISFLIVAFAVFFLVKGINTLKRQEEAPAPEPTTKECPRCFSVIPVKATRCGFCTSELSGT
jgi:large conductance mechanosensitive channel